MNQKMIIVLFIFILLLLGLRIGLLKQNTSHLKINIGEKITPQMSVTNRNIMTKTTIVTKSFLFIPYWALPQSKIDVNTYNRLMYFGIDVDGNGVQKNEDGYKQLNLFQTVTKDYLGKKSLVIRMLNTENNVTILNDEKIQNKIIREVNDVIKENGFTELALDLELSGIFNTDITNKINVFVQKIYTLENRHYRHFSVIMYGDVFYRNRPFDIKSIGKNCDEIMIMAYDYSKPYGEPGPNMPFTDKQKWGYDFKEMISDYTSEVSSEKLTVIFGMYGYDWTLNKQGTPLKRAEAKSVVSLQLLVDRLKQNVSRFTLHVTRNAAREPMIEYIDEEGQKHVIWYEDEESAQVKIDYLKEQGIGSIGYWAYSYY